MYKGIAYGTGIYPQYFTIATPIVNHPWGPFY